MKALIMTAQDAWEFEALGGLTITKPIKPAPPRIEGATFDAYGPDGWTISGDGRGPVYKPPVKAGDIVFLREPWARLKNPTTGEPSDRVILAADSTVSEGQTSYKWASPVSMPEDAARRFAVVSKVEPIYNENVAVWSITLEAVTKSAAEAGETGALPYSDASSPEEGSNYYTYAGDMSPEDHERMAEEINQDRARLAEVQDRIIQLDSLRRELDRRAAPPEEYVPIGEEGLAIMKEEADLRNALEDAGAPAPTTADHAREKLAAIRSRRGEIAAAGQKDRVFEDLDGEEENLAAEERDLTAYLEGIAAEEDDPLGEESPTRDGEPTPSDDQEDEEVGSFTFGKCSYCGREWGVTLEGAKGGGYPTQKTANAAATRVCDCPEAVENRKPEVGVAFAVTTGACRYCGQLQEVGPHPSQAADETATEVCSCPSARTARRTAEQIEDARDRVNRLFGERAEDLGFKPIAGDGAIELLEHVVELIARGPISSASLNIRGQCKAKFLDTFITEIKRDYEDAERSSLVVANKETSIASSLADMADRQRIEQTYAQGATQIYSQALQANCDQSSGAAMDFFIPEEMRIINRVLVKIRMAKFRAYSKSTESDASKVVTSTTSDDQTRTSSDGGRTTSTTTTSDDQTRTSSDGGRTTATSSGGGGTSTTTESAAQMVETSDSVVLSAENVMPNEAPQYNAAKHNHALPPRGKLALWGGTTEDGALKDAGYATFVESGAHSHGAHSHNITIRSHRHRLDLEDHNHRVTIPAHSHETTIPGHSHRVTIPDHKHTITIPGHSHKVTVPGHSHNITPGIYQYGNPQKFGLYINGIKKADFSGRTAELDITDLLTAADNMIPRGSWLSLEVRPDDLAHISIDLIVQGFIQSRGDKTV